MTLRESFYYIYGILECYYDKTRDEELVMLGSDLNPFLWYDPTATPEEVSTGDPATWGDWLKAVNKVSPNKLITMQEALKAMMELLKQYNQNEWGHLDEIIRFFSQDSINKDVFKT